MLWYGYKYKPSGTYQAKPYMCNLDISEVAECVGDTVYFVTSYFEARSREEALLMVKLLETRKEFFKSED